MKINFSLPYKAHWGEMLCVNLTFYSSRGASQEVKLLMSTRDGYHWMVETSTRENRQHPFDLIYYYYTVVDEDGKVLRTESVDSPRVYVYDSSKSYIFDDFWLEEKLAARMATAIGRTPKVDVESYERMECMPLFSETVIFKVHAPRLHEGEAIALLGNHPTLGNWNIDHFLQMKPLGKHEWVLSVNVAPIDAPIEFKYIIVNTDTQRFKRWEYGENRTLDERIYQGEVHVLHGGDFRIKKFPPHAQFDFETYVFDLDGTLISSLEDLASSCNYALRTNQLPERSIEEVRMMVGNGVKLLMERAIGKERLESGEVDFDRVFQDFRNHYMVHNLDETAPYPGIMDMLKELKARGKNIAVVSNKFYAATEELCRHFFGDLVDVAIGEREGIEKKPAPDTVNEALRLLHADRETAVYIGDSDVDVMTARNSHMPCISVLWGFRDCDFLSEHGATIYVSAPDQLL